MVCPIDTSNGSCIIRRRVCVSVSKIAVQAGEEGQQHRALLVPVELQQLKCTLAVLWCIIFDGKELSEQRKACDLVKAANARSRLV